MNQLENLFADGGRVGALLRDHEWSASPLGDPATWPPPLRHAVDLVLQSRFPMFVAWGDDLHVLYNDAFADILGRKHPGALGRRVDEVWPDIWSELGPLVASEIAGQPIYRDDLALVINRRGYDEQAWFTFSYSPMRDERGGVAGLFCVLSETTDRVLTARALRELNESLARRTSEALAERKLLADIVESGAFHQVADLDYRWLAILGQLTGGVVREFNNLFAVFAGAVDMLERSHQPITPRVLDGMRQAITRGSGLTRRLLAFSRRRPVNTESIDPVEHLSGMQRILEGALGAQIHVRMRLAPGLWPIDVDAGELELAIVNLCLNARDAMPGGGIIIIAAENVRADDDNGGLRDFVKVTVADVGTGMAPDIQARVFEPFFSTKDAGKGLGLGLTQVAGFARQSGGRVTIDSEAGVGTFVTLLLPRAGTRGAP